MKTPNLVQRTGVVPPLAYTQLPKVNVIPTAVDPNSYNRPGSAQSIPANTGPAVRPPQVR